MNISYMQSEQDFLEHYREMVLDYLNSEPNSEDRKSCKAIVDALYDEWDTVEGNADALTQVWTEKVFCWI
jgi:hypothetical protein